MRDQDAFHAVLRTDFLSFVRKTFATVWPDVAYRDNWHIEAIVHLLIEIHRGNLTRLIINQPPRSLKSLVVSVAYAAWKLGHDPSCRIVVVSYASELATELHRQWRLVVQSDWYRAAFPEVRMKKDTADEFITSKGGGRWATSVDGVFTGRGADLAIIDDPQKEADTYSDVNREKTWNWVTGTLFSRLNDKATSPIIVVQQRIHEDDVTGRLLLQAGWTHLKLSAIATENETIDLGNGCVHHRREGEALHPEREDLETLEQIRLAKGSLGFSLAYQQEPVPVEGNLVKQAWFRFVDEAPERGNGVQYVQSWDVASSVRDNADYSVCITFAKARNDYTVVDVWRGRLTYPDLRRRVATLAERYKASTILIEDAGPGQSLLQDLWNDTPYGMARPIGRRPDGSKEERMGAQTAKIEAGRVHLVRNASWLATFLNEVLAFPAGRHDDQVDALSQFLAWTEVHRPMAFVVGSKIIGA